MSNFVRMKRIPASLHDCHRLGSTSSLATASLMAFMSFSGTTKPERPGSMPSATPPLSNATNGVPTAWNSSMATPRASAWPFSST
jgi:hypothetical protein